MRLSTLEKSHLAYLVKGESWAANTTWDFEALDKLVDKGLARRYGNELIATEKGKTYCRNARNLFTKAQIALLHRRIARGKPWVPKVGQLVYTDTRLSLGHGNDDVQGGIAQVTKVYSSMSGGDANCQFIEIAQHDRGGNWTQFLCPDQKKLKQRFGFQVAYPDPDDRPSMNEGW